MEPLADRCLSTRALHVETISRHRKKISPPPNDQKP
jgi:hypothetical protein